MKRFRHMVIGGIENKIFNLILFTIILLTAAYTAMSLVQGNMTADLAEKSTRQQQEAIEEISSSVMDQVVNLSLERSNRTEARFANEMFDAVQRRILFLSDYTAKLFAYPERYLSQAYTGPDPADDGTWTAKVIYADGVDADDPAIAERVGLLANMSEIMVSMCPTLGAADFYIALPEGVHLSVSDASSSWFVEGEMRSYDPRQRDWYRLAVQKGDLIFTDGEWDATTGEYCVECAMPVYGPDGSLKAVVGTDLFLSEMQRVLQDSSIDGEYSLLVNKDGIAVLPAQVEAFPTEEDLLWKDLRNSSYEVLARVVDHALQGNISDVELGELGDGMYYMTGSPIETTGWVLVSAYNQAVSDQPTTTLLESTAQIQEEAAAAYQSSTDNTKKNMLLLLAAGTLLTLTGALLLGKRIVKPLNTITKRISALSEGNLEFKMEDAYRTGDEVEELAESFAAISHRTVLYMDRVRKVTAEKERISAELSLATDIQTAMMPHIFPAFPDCSEFDIFASMNPAKEVGGDFYDYYLVDDDHLCMVIADVSGKGVPAALFMMASKIILQSVAMLGYSPAEILARTNQAVCSNNEAEMFVTVWLGILELSTGKLVAANAGHEYPALKSPDGPFEMYKDRHGFVIGGMEDIRYREYEMQMKPGEMLFVYTDGVPEATNNENEMFGTQRMIDALNVVPEAGPQEVLMNVKRAVDEFVDDAEQFDDLTMLCLVYKGKDGTPSASAE